MRYSGRLPAAARSLVTLLVTLLCLRAAAAPVPPPREKAAALLASHRPLIIAHRGYSALAPENTLESFRLALGAGADLVELDYYHSRDGVPMVFHDSTLDRTSDAVRRWGEKKVSPSSRSADELASLDVGSWFHPRHAGLRLPRLSEALDLIQSNGVTLVERKGGDAATCVRLLAERNLLNEVVVQSFDWAYLRDYHQREPRQILGAIGPPSTRQGRKLAEADKTLDAAWVDEARATGARVVVWNRQVTPAAVAAAHGQGLKVWVYTIDDPAVANQLLDLGVDGIITNNPGLQWRTLALRGHPRPPTAP